MLRSIRNGLFAALVPCALMLLAHYTIDPREPPLTDAYTFILQWSIVGVVSHTSSLKIPIFWSALLWSLIIGWLGAAWGTYFGRDIHLTLLLPQLIGGFVMAPISWWLERRF